MVENDPKKDNFNEKSIGLSFIENFYQSSSPRIMKISFWSKMTLRNHSNDPGSKKMKLTGVILPKNGYKISNGPLLMGVVFGENHPKMTWNK